MSNNWNMRPSRVLKKLRAGKTAFSTKLNLTDSRGAELAAMSGFDCLWTCQEHVPNDFKVVENQIMAAKIYDCDTVCRVPKGSYSDFIRPFELDASGIMVPHVMSLKEAQEIVRMTRFHPIGRRPLDGGNTDGKFTRVPVDKYLEQSNTERFIILQIEDPEPLEELEEIAALPGYDILFFGPADFSHSIGDPGNFDNPLVVETKIRIAELAKKHGKFAGTVGTTDNFEELVDIGYSFINIGADVRALIEYYDKITGKLGIRE